MECVVQGNDIFVKLQKKMEAYNSDFEGAVRRSAEIDEDERRYAEQEVINREILERFGMI